MYVKYHAIFSLPLIIYGIKIEGSWLYGLVAYLTSILIDSDHYLAYIVIKKDLSLINAIKYFNNKHSPTPYIFHTVYFLGFIFALKYFVTLEIARVIDAMFKGLIFHITLDIVYAIIAMLHINSLIKLGTKTKKESRSNILSELVYRLFLIKLNTNN